MKFIFCETALRIKGRKIDCLMFETNHDRALKEECQKLGYTVFELRHSSEDWGFPCNIEDRVIVDFWGYMAVGNPDDAQFLSEWIAKDSYIGVTADMFSGWPFRASDELPKPSPAK